MNNRVIGALYKKEMTDILRDKKTILMMVVIPLILYPLIFVGSMYLSSSIMNASTSNTYRVGFDHVPEETELRDFFEEKAKEYHYQFLFLVPHGLEEESNGAVISVLQEHGDETEYASYEEALDLVEKMLQDSLEETGEANLRTYLMRRNSREVPT